jgi:hypothetical protein
VAGAERLKPGVDLSLMTGGSALPVDCRIFSTLSLKRRQSHPLTVWWIPSVVAALARNLMLSIRHVVVVPAGGHYVGPECRKFYLVKVSLLIKLIPPCRQ